MAKADAGSATDACGGTVNYDCVAVDAEPVAGANCGYSQAFKVTATGTCGKTTDCMVTYTWTENEAGPTFDGPCPKAVPL